ncbi:hypothetical protein GCM10009663_52500 [Kitasatospora arboriphila]|uniref:Serine/threonine protein kinase n=1 Tax=Kitasatospora arboriphila TaxID=258052 RepID=A0ABN1TUL8_9ACTN
MIGESGDEPGPPWWRKPRYIALLAGLVVAAIAVGVAVATQGSDGNVEVPPAASSSPATPAESTAGSETSPSTPAPTAPSRPTGYTTPAPTRTPTPTHYTTPTPTPTRSSSPRTSPPASTTSRATTSNPGATPSY